MTALTKDRATPYREGVEIDYPVAANAKIYAGSLVCVNTDGYAVPAADTASFLLAGMALQQVDNTGGANGAKTIRVRRKGVFEFQATSITKAMVGSMMYVKDDQTFDNTSNNLVPCGRLAKYISATKGQIDIEPATLGTYNISVDGDIDVLANLTLEDGTVLTKYAAATAPGWAQISDKERVLKWAAHATPVAVAFGVSLPADLDGGADVQVKVAVAMTGATDTPVLEMEAYFDKGDTDCAGTDPEITGGATLTWYTMTIDKANVPDGPAHLTVVLKPKSGELGTDDLHLYAARVSFTRKNAA